MNKEQVFETLDEITNNELDLYESSLDVMDQAVPMHTIILAEVIVDVVLEAETQLNFEFPIDDEESILLLSYLEFREMVAECLK